MMQPPPRLAHKQAGLTLIELLIAMALGLMIVSVVIGILVSGQQSQRLQQGYEELQNSGRHALSFLAQEIRRAGFDENGSLAIAALQGPGTDLLKLAYTNMLDCSGATGNVWVAYRLSDAELMCDGDEDPAQALTTEVEALGFLYGEDTGSSTSAADGLFDRSINVWRHASQVTNWSHVQAVQAAILLRSSQEVLDQDLSQSITFFPGYTAAGTYNDRHLRRVFRTTVYLRNRE
jgi:competence protein ComGC